MNDLALIIDLANKHAWPALATVVIGLLVRLLKSPAVPAPLDRIPPKARPLVALVLGIASGCLEAVLAGTPWQQALVGGLVAAALAVFGHQLVIEGARDGRELGAPKPFLRQVEVTVPEAERDTVPPATPRNAGDER